MAMLAEPRRKVKYGTDPRGTAWSKDETKFGQKLMEKMGWSKGKGLGANEDGNTDHIAVSVKLDNKGVGCSKSHADNWIAHQDDFNSLLSSLNENHATDGAEEEERKVLSLEETSRKSRGRVHYQKFTKGKDLSLKSASDLDCVLGKRKARPGTDTPQDQSETSSGTSDLEEEQQEPELNTFTSTDSVQDYFARKMAEKMAKLSGKGGNQQTGVTKAEPDIAEEETKMEKRKKKKKGKKRKFEEESEDSSKKIKVEDTESEGKHISFFLDGENETAEAEAETENSEISIKKKKSKKKKKERNSQVEVDTTGTIEKDSSDEVNAESDPVGRVVENMVDSANVDCGQLDRKKSKKNKRKKKSVEEELHNHINNDNIDGKKNHSSSENAIIESGAIGKKKKNKKKDSGKNSKLPSLTSNKDNLVLNKSKLSKDEVEKYGSMISSKVNKANGEVKLAGGNRSKAGFKGANVDKIQGYGGKA